MNESSTEVNEFSRRLKTLRGPMSQSAFARSLGIENPSTYHYYEKGRIPSSQVVKHIAEVCGVTADWLLGGPDQATEKDEHLPAYSAEALSVDRAVREKSLAWVDRAPGNPVPGLSMLQTIVRQIEVALAQYEHSNAEKRAAYRRLIELLLTEYDRYCEEHCAAERAAVHARIQEEKARDPGRNTPPVPAGKEGGEG